MDGYGATYWDRYPRITSPFRDLCFGLLWTKGKQLSESSNVEPGLTGQSCRFCGTKRVSQSFFGAFAQTVGVIILALVGLYENRMTALLKAITDFALEADIADFAKGVKIGSWPVAVKRVPVRVGVLHTEHDCKVDLILQNKHSVYSLVAH